ncbi:hypothetical protein CCHR01_15376 [Colletotrichum chrysophilum]|uniref:Uncharacterized protein n=1 Tax=Colletotrichum chrysophilum TaxID=1836956 RepID=A0AAD9A5S9_9PEZI|nr:hypothetical protein CCHR01_15376 [Colletotrichum chrysophilum]
MRRMWRRERGGQRGARGEWRRKTGGQEEQAERREWGGTRHGDDGRRIGLARRTGLGLRDGSCRLSSLQGLSLRLCLSLSPCPHLIPTAAHSRIHTFIIDNLLSPSHLIGSHRSPAVR